MKITYSLLLMLLLSGLCLAQTKNELVGRWQVEEVLIPKDLAIPKESQQQVKAMQQLLLQGTFLFEANGKCSLDIPDQTLQFQNAEWSYNPQQKLIQVKEKANSPGLLMGIVVQQQANGSTYFLIEETPIRLRVKKG